MRHCKRYVMIEIIPSINAPTLNEVRERIARVEPHATWCHLDVTDGVFSRHPTWRDPRDLLHIVTPLHIEVHLMIERPEMTVDQWAIPPVRRIIVHEESCSDIPFVIATCREAGIEAGLAIKPETPWEKLIPWVKEIDIAQILAVPPGPSGQKIDEHIVDKIHHLHIHDPGCIIEEDGGINPDTVSRVVQAGATLLVAGSFLFDADEIAKAMQALRDAAESVT